ncbi:hypothetical protein H1R20_g985, partial [Candolleomyces eurysporus]
MICAFDFDALHYSLAAITEDSTLTLWNLQDTIPYVIHKVRGKDDCHQKEEWHRLPAPRSLQQEHPVNNQVVNGNLHEDPEMFGHANFDGRIQTSG